MIEDLVVVGATAYTVGLCYPFSRRGRQLVYDHQLENGGWLFFFTVTVVVFWPKRMAIHTPHPRAVCTQSPRSGSLLHLAAGIFAFCQTTPKMVMACREYLSIKKLSLSRIRCVVDIMTLLALIHIQ